MKNLLIAGCGDLGIRLAKCLSPAAWTIHGLRRSPRALPTFIRALGADLLDASSLEVVRGHWDAIVYQATPGGRTAQAYQATYVDGLRGLMRVAETERLIVVSSTAVYGQDAGEWVDETSPTEPPGFSGRILLEAEALAAEQAGLVVRFSGIYGPGREALIHSLQAGQARCRRDPPQWTNRIHADDCAGVLKHLLEHPAPEHLYCASDCMPAPRWEVLQWLAEQLALPMPPANGEPDGQGKRVANQRLLASGFRFLYPDYQSGYRTLLP